MRVRMTRIGGTVMTRRCGTVEGGVRVRVTARVTHTLTYFFLLFPHSSSLLPPSPPLSPRNLLNSVGQLCPVAELVEQVSNQPIITLYEQSMDAIGPDTLIQSYGCIE